MPNNRPKIKGNALTGLNSVIDGIGIITKPLKTSAVTANTAVSKAANVSFSVLFLCAHHSAYFCTSLTSTSTHFSREGTGKYSKRPWKLCPPVKILGHGSPISESLAPSVPPRTGIDAARFQLHALHFQPVQLFHKQA